MLTFVRMASVTLFISLGVCLVPLAANAGIGVRGGVQVRGKLGTTGVAGGHIDASLVPLLRVRPNVEVGKKGSQTLINPSVDIHLKLNPVGIGPRPYIGGGAGVQAVRTKVTVLGVTTTKTAKDLSYHVLGGIDIPVAPFVRVFVEGKGVFVKKNRTVRLIGGLTLSL